MNDLYLIEKSVRKINHWQYENEYRYVISPYIELHAGDDAIGAVNVVDDSGYPDSLFIPLYKDIEEVVLGIEMDSAEEKEVMEFLKNNGIENVVKSSIRMNR